VNEERIKFLMSQVNERLWTGLYAIALLIAGIGFILYPTMRPFSDEVSLEGAAAFASNRWISAHIIAVFSFTLLLLGVFGLYKTLRQTNGETRANLAFALTILGTSLTLPFYGGEAYGLHAVGIEALQQNSAALLDLAATIRSGVGLILFVTALVVLAIGLVIAAAAIWKSGTFSKWSGVPLALGIALYLPQFFGTQPIRIAHGVLVAVGCWWIGLQMWSHK
jgi:hypothetical protein